MTTTDTLPDLSEAYRDLRVRVDALVRGRRRRAVHRRWPRRRPSGACTTCSRTSSASPADILAGRLDGVASDAWTEAQVAPRRDLPTAALLDEWAGPARRWSR